MPEPLGERTRTVSGVSTTASPADFTFAITLVALALRLIVAIFVVRTHTADWFFHQATELGCMATSLLQGHGFSSPFCGDTGPSAFLAPGYPLFVAAVFRLLGAYTLHSALCILLTQALLGTAAVPVAMWAARRAFGVRTAHLAGILCAFNPWLIGMEAVFWETTLSILLMTALVGLAIAIQQKPSSLRLYLAAVVMTLAVSVNPSLAPTGFVLLLIVLSFAPTSQKSHWGVPLLLLLGLCAYWPVRNLRTLHAFVPLRSNMGYELWQGNRPGADGFFEATLHPNANALEYKRYKDLGEMAYMREKSALATSWIEAHPQRFAALTAKRIACFWLGLWRTFSLLRLFGTAVLSLLGWMALFPLFRKDRKLGGIFVVPLLLLPLPYYISHPDFRFFCLLTPTLSILVAWRLAELMRKRKVPELSGRK